MTTSPRLTKLTRVAPSITSQAHLDRVLLSFRDEELPLAKEILRGILPASLEVREIEVQVVPKNSEAPTVTEETVMRLNAQAEQIKAQQVEIASRDKTISELQAQIKQAEYAASVERAK